jgi:hypothetical protein
MCIIGITRIIGITGIIGIATGDPAFGPYAALNIIAAAPHGGRRAFEGRG